MKEHEIKYIKAGVQLGLVLLIAGVLIWANIGMTPETKEETMSWKPIQLYIIGQEADPGSGNSGILGVYFINHSVANDYKDVNSSDTLESWCNASGLGYANADNQEIDLAHSTAFDIVVRVRGNSTVCKRDSTWWDTDLNVTITWSDGSLSDAQPDGQTTSATADFNTSSYTYLYVNFYWDNSDSGFTISKGDTSEIASIEFAAYY